MGRLVTTCSIVLGLLACIGSRHACGSEIYPTSYFNGTVGKFAADGTPINTSLITGLSTPSGITLGPDGFLYVANRGSGNIGRYSTTGTGNATFLTGLSAPFGIAFDGSGDCRPVMNIALIRLPLGPYFETVPSWKSDT